MMFWSTPRGGAIETKSAAMLICSPVWRKRHLTRAHIDFLEQRWSEQTLRKVRQSCFWRRTEISMMNSQLLVSIVDDDESVRESLPDLLEMFGLASQTFSSAEEFLAKDGISRSKCLILDVAMPGMRGPELQKELNRRKIKVPIIFITGLRDERLRSQLVEQGAIACLTKPFSDSAMLEALNSALQVK
jgi:CheY-like chemotaxis protein